MANPTVGYATLQVIPSARGFSQSLGKEMSGPLGKASKDAGDSSGAGFSSGFSTAAKAGVAAAAVVVAAAFAKGFGDALEKEKAGDKLAAQLGLTPQQQSAFGKAAGDLYAQAYGDSLGQVNEALGAVQSTIGDSLGPAEDALTVASAKALDFAAAFDTDVTDAVTTAGVLLKEGLAGDADEAFDLMVSSMQQIPAGLRDELGEATKEYSKFFGDLGISGEEMLGLFATADDAFALDKIGDSLKELTIRATDMSTASVDAYEEAGLNAEEMAGKILAGGDEAREGFGEIIDGLIGIKDPVKQANAAIGLFGTPLEDLGTSEIPAFLQSLGSMETGLGDVEGAAERMGDTLNDNAATKIEVFKRQALGGLTDFIGGTVIPGVEGLMQVFDEEGLGGIVDRLVVGIQTGAPILRDQILEWGKALVDWIGPQIEPALGKLGEFLQAGATWLLEEGLPKLAEGVAVLVPALVDWIVNEGLPGAIEALGKFGEGVNTWIEEEGADAFREFGARLAEAMVAGFSKVGNTLMQAALEQIPGASLLLSGSNEYSGGDPKVDEILRGLGYQRPDGRARGGPVYKNRPYVVGENRPELFVPNQSGMIIPRVPDFATADSGAMGAAPLIGSLVVQQQPGEDAAGAINRMLGHQRLIAMEVASR